MPRSAARLRIGIAVLGYGTAAVFLLLVAVADSLIVRAVPPDDQQLVRLVLLTLAVGTAVVFSVGMVGRFAARYVHAQEAAGRLEETQLSEARLRTLNEFARAIASKLDLDSVMGLLLGELPALIGCARCSVSAHDAAQGVLRLLASRRADGSPDVLPGTTLDVADSVIGSVVMRGETLVLDDAAAAPFGKTGRRALAGLASVVGVPIMVGDRVWGVLTAAFESRGGATTARVEILSAVAGHLAVAIGNAELYAELRGALDQVRSAQAQIVQQERLRALGEMAGGVAHDLNNALAPVVGFSELLRVVPGALDDRAKAHQYLDLIHTGATDAAETVRRLREFYRSQDAAADHVPVSLSALAEQVVALTEPKWRNDAQATGRTIAVRTELADGASIVGSEPQLREALTNLLFNAVDATPHGGTITLRTVVRGHRSVVEVMDTGAGMSPETRRRALEPFFTTKGERGTGLGLSMVHGIAQRHGGTLDIDSAPGRGTTVSLSFPAAACPSAGARLGGGGAHHDRANSALRILLVDDETGARLTVAELLSADGHRVESVEDGRAALTALDAQPFDLIITDRAMPGMSGDQLAARAKGVTPHTPILMISGYGDLMNARGERSPHVDQVLAKPVTLRALRASVEKLTADLA